MKKFLQKLVAILFVGVFAVGAFAQTTPTIAEGEQAVFFENTGNWSGDIYAYIWANGGAVEWVGGWPGEACTYLGDNIWKWTYSGEPNIYGETTVSGGLIFNNKGAGKQTADLEFVNGGYYNANGYVKTITPTGGDEVDSSLVALSNVFVAGSFNNWASTDQEHSMSLELDFYIKRYENMPAGTYEFKIVDNGKWIGAEYVDAANSTKGYVGVPGGNISFTLPQPATVIISYAPWYGAIYLVAEGIDQFGQFEIEYYSVCGSKEIFGEDFLTDVYRENIDDYKMVEEDGVYTKTFTSIHLDADVEYRYKVAANGTWNEGQYPQNGDMLFAVSQTGIYDLTFTYIPDSDLLRVDPVFIESSNVIDSVYYEAVICYGDVYEFGGMVLSETGIYQLESANGDTIITLNLTVLPDYRQTYDATIKEGEVYSGHGFEGLTQPGTYALPFHSLSTGCDSTITLNLSVVAAEEGEMPMEVEFANIATIYEMGMWDMKYYESYLNYDVKAILKSQPTVVEKVVVDNMMGSMNNYYLNDGTGVIVLQAPATGVDWIGSIVEGLELEVGKKLPADFMATIDFKCVSDEKTWLPNGEVYGAPVMTFVQKVVGVDATGMEITESYADFAARCEASDFVEEAVEVSVDELLANRIAYAGQLVTLNAEGNYYAEILEDVYAGTTSTTAYMYWNASEVFDVEVYDGTTYVSPKMTEDYYNYVGKLFNVQGENLPVASFDAKETINVATARFDWNAIAMGQSLLVKDYIVGEEEPVVPPTAMPANGVIYFDPAGKFSEDLTVRFIGADGSVEEAADVINLGEIYRITMPAGNEWMRFEVDAWGDDPATPESNFVQLYLVSGLVYTGEYNLFTLNADAPNQATAENGVWSNHVVHPIQGGSVFFYSLAESAYFSEAEEGLITWKAFFVNAEGTEAEVEVELIDDDIYKIVAPEGTWEMLRISLYVAASGREVNRLYLENDGEHNMFKLGADASPYALVGSWDVYNTEVPEVIATWSIEEGAVIESFTGVTVTFSGIDPVGRKVDGKEVTRVYPLISAVKTFFVVNEDGTTTPVVAGENDSYSGILTCSASGVTSALSLGTDRYALVDGAFLKNGNYRIVLPANKVQYQPKVDGANVFGDKDFVLNFSIVNDYVEPAPVTEIEVPFTVSVENNSTVAELSEIVITYPDVARIRVSEPMAPQTPATWVFLSQTLVDETGNVTASQAMAPLYWQQVSANSFKVMVNLSAIGGPETLTMEGTYSIDVPAGLVMFSETEVNKAFSLNYTIETVSPEEPAGPVEVTTMDELKAHAGERVLYRGLEPMPVVEGEGFWAQTFYMMPDGTTNLNYFGYVIPANMDAYGTYYESYSPDDWTEPAPTFVIDEVATISAFNTMGDLANFVKEEATDAQKSASYEVVEPIIVTLQGMMSLYAQYEAQSMFGGASWQGISLRFNPMMMTFDFQPKAGDAIAVTGVYSPAVYDENDQLQQPAYFNLESATLKSENNKLNCSLLELAYGVSGLGDSYGAYCRLQKGGKIVEKTDGYFYEFEYSSYEYSEELGDYVEVVNTLSLLLQQAGPVDITEYIGKDFDKFLVGVLDFDPYYGPMFYCTEIQDTKLYYNNIAEMIAAGSQNDYSMSSALRNPVVVNYIYYNEWGGYTLFVEDATGVLVVRGVGVWDEEIGGYTFPYEIEEGDSILGINGFFEGGCTMWTGADYGINVDLTYVSEGEVNVIEVALDALVEDQAAWQEASWNGEVYVSPYANRVVKLTDLTLEETDDDATAYWVQGESKLEFNPRLWNRLGLEVPANVAALTGIADYEGIWNYSFTVIPTNVEVESDIIEESREEVICYGDVYEFGGMVLSETGIYQLESANGDTIITLNLTVLPAPIYVEESVEINYGESYYWMGEEYTMDGTYSYVEKYSIGCDSMIYVLNLTVLPEIVTYNVSAYSNDESQGTVWGVGEYEEDSIATLVAIPNEGYVFDHWEDMWGYWYSDEDTLELVVDGDYYLYAYFKPVPVLIDGVYYCLYDYDGYKEAMVARSEDYTGALVIPSEVIYNGETYYVAGFEENALVETSITSLEVANSIISGVDLFGCYDLITLKAHSDFIVYCSNIVYANIKELYITGGYVYWSASVLSQLELIDMSAAENTELWEGVFMPHYDDAYNYFDNLRTIVLPTGLTTLTARQFQGLWMLEEIVIPEGVTEIPNGAFYDCHALRNVTFEGVITSIGNYAFYNCHAMESVVIPEGVTEIGNAAFYGCTYLEEIELPSTLEEVGDNAFALCSKVKSIKVKAPMPPALRAKTFYEVDRNTPVYVEEVAYDDYVADQYWSEFFNIIAVPGYDGPTTDVDANEESSIVIYTQGGMLYVDGLEADYNVFDAAGRLIYTGRDAQLSLPKGVYMLSVGDKTYKVAM